jgi:amidase
MSPDIHYQPLTTVAAQIKSKAISPVEVTEALLGRIETLDPGLKSYTTVTPELAMDQARAAEAEIMAGRYRGPMHGIPIAVKDLCFTKGIPTSAGMSIYRDYKPDHDATVVTRLAAAGSVLLGKLHMTEGATLEHHPSFPEPVNPWKSDLWTGVSSSGSGVATAAGLTYASIGSDTGGSIRFPSACNNLTGVKPTWGLISRYGIFDLAATYDHLGPMARSAADAAAMLQALAGWDVNDPTTLPGPVPDYLAGLEGIYGARGVRLGVDWSYVAEGAEPQTVAALEAAIAVLESLGAIKTGVDFPDLAPLLKYNMALTIGELLAAHEATYPARADEYGPAIKQMMKAADVTPTQLGHGNIERRKFRGAVISMFSSIDVFVMPVFKLGTPTWSEMRAQVAEDFDLIGKFTSPFNATGTPTVTLPCGFTSDGRPIALQLAGAPGSEALLLKVADAYQQATDWHTRRPPGI